MHTGESSVFEPFKDEIATEKLKRHKAPGTDQYPAELVQAAGNTPSFEIHKVINCTWNKEELPQQWNLSIIMPAYKIGDKLTVVIIEGYHCYKLHIKYYIIFLFQG
jgi:hypothetical protein